MLGRYATLCRQPPQSSAAIRAGRSSVVTWHTLPPTPRRYYYFPAVFALRNRSLYYTPALVFSSNESEPGHTSTGSLATAPPSPPGGEKGTEVNHCGEGWIMNPQSSMHHLCCYVASPVMLGCKYS